MPERRLSLSPVWWTVLLSLALAVVWVAVYLGHPGVVESVEYRLTDRLVAGAGEQRRSDSVVVVDIDEQALAARGQWPWPRYRLARLLDDIVGLGARSVALDFVLAEPDQTSLAAVHDALQEEFGVRIETHAPSNEVLDNDKILANTLSRGPFVLGYQLLFGEPARSDNSCPSHPLSMVVRTPANGRDPVRFLGASGGVCSLAQLTVAVDYAGFMNGHLDSDGRLRRLPLVLQHGNALYPSLTLAALMRAAGVRTLRLDTTVAAQPYVMLADNAIPLDPDGHVRIRFPAERSDLPHVSAEDVLSGRASPERFRGRIVFVGVNAPGIGQAFQTPARTPLSTAEIHAQLAETILTRDYVRRPDPVVAAELAVAFGLAVLAGIGVARAATGVTLLCTAVVLAGLWAGSTLLVRNPGLLVSPLLPGWVVAINGVVLLMVTYWVRQRRAQRGMSEALVLMRRSERELSSILDTIPDIVFRLDTEGRVTFISPAVTRYRQRPEGLIGTPVLDLVAPGDQTAARHRINERRTGQRATRDMEIRLLLAEDGGEHATGERYFSVSAEGIYAGDVPGTSSFIGTQGIARDIEQRRRLETQLAHSKQMEAMGTLAAGVAHDLNNILGALVGYPELLLLDLPPGSPMRESLEAIQQSGQRAGAIVQDMLTIARRGVQTHEVININDTVRAYLESPEARKLQELHPNVRCTAERAPGLMNTLGSPVQLSKVIMNMVTNSAEAMPAGGHVCLATQNRYLDLDLRGYERIPEGEYVQLSIIDDGVGIAQEHVAKIFEPFYSKKKLGRSGSGLGMAVVWSTIKDHRGFIDVQSREGEGTRFDLYLPVTRRDREEGGRKLVLQDYLGTERVLVVDDVPDQLTIAVRMLGKLGYDVATASSGEQAVEYLRTHTVDLVVLDMVMPAGIDGLETYRRIQEIRPRQRAIIASGYSESERVTAAQALGVGAYIRKPYTLETVGMAVRREIDRKDS